MKTADHPMDRNGRAERERELANELRAIIGKLSTVEPSADGLSEGLRLARLLREQLNGEPRVRWYQAAPSEGAPRGPESGVAYGNQSPVRGELNPIAPPLRVEFVRPGGDERDYVEGVCTLGRAYEGMADAAHGGWVAALFDDILGAAQRLVDAAGVTAVLRTRFREVTPLGEELRFRAWIHQQRGRRTIIRATCHAGQLLTADAEGIFMQVDFAQIHARMEALRSERQ
jgi:hypothetical protein